jgi:DNA polymerase (family X)
MPAPSPLCSENSADTAPCVRATPFLAKAYTRAPDNLLALSLSLDQVIAQDRLREIPGVGNAIAEIIKKLHATGTHPALEKMRHEIPRAFLRC